MTEGRPFAQSTFNEARTFVASDPWARRAREERATGRGNEPPAFSEKNVSRPTLTSYHAPSPSITRNPRTSHARSVFMVIELPPDFGDRVRFLRTEKGLSQRELAELSGLGEATVGRAEAGKTATLLQTAHSIARGLGLTLAQLVGEEGAEHGNDRSEGDGR